MIGRVTPGYQTRMGRFMRRFLGDETGSQVVEFLYTMPALFMMALSSIDGGLLLAKYMMLERAVDINVRSLRLGSVPSPTTLTNSICEDIAIIDDCAANLVLEIQPIDRSTWAMPNNNTPCYNRQEDIDPVTTFQIGVEAELMLLRACVIVDPLFDTFGYGEIMNNTNSGDYYITSASVFVNEP